MPRVRTYDPKAGVLTIGGTPIGGYADGTSIEHDFDEDAYSKVNGMDGVTSRAKSTNKGSFLTITLAQTSPSNDTLSALALADELSNTGVVPVVYKDLSGTTTLFSPNGWVRRKAPLSYDKTITNRIWIIDLADTDVHVGGNVLP
ncbi:hypothetical protein KAR91_48755 [Candidatus Pacearchaeota archaeon]|nr:hypothetical protein [Candidatus Pacearchaeota archaeon]